jgi:ATP-dependent helicase/nuclease subunit A
LKELKKNLQTILGFHPEIWPRHAEITEKFLKLAREFTAACTESKRKSGFLTMADLELRTAEVLRREPQAAEDFSQEWDYWFVDEYQDTSPLQEEILERLQGGRPKLVVGDPQQSIYLFRGARAEVFLRQEESFQNRETLGDNYRSRPELVHFFNRYFPSMNPSFITMNPKADVKSDVEAVTFLKASSEEEEFQNIARWVGGLMKKNIRPDEICVLAGTNDRLKSIASVFKAHGIPHRVHSSGGFGSRREIRDALALLKFIIHPHDNLNLLTLLRGPVLHVEDSKLEALRARGSDLWGSLAGEKSQTSQKLSETRELSARKGIYLAFAEALHALGFFTWARLSDESGVREANLFKLLQDLREEQKIPGFNYLTYIDDVLDKNTEERESDGIPAVEPNRVNLMTVHAAKGLQFSHVIVAGFSHGKTSSGSRTGVSVDEDLRKLVISIPDDEGEWEALFPARQISRKYFEREMAEGERLLYVAFTRARASLFVAGLAEAESGSWHERCPLDLEAGEHAEKDFRYRVVTEVPAETAVQKTEATFENQGRRFTELGRLKIPKTKEALRVPVTRLLESQTPAPTGAGPDVMSTVDRIRTGIELHNIFETLGLCPGEEERRRVLEAAPEKYREAVDYVFHEAPLPFEEILRGGEVEYGFVYRLGEKLLEGKIDLWGMAGGELWIVDYKTGSEKYLEKAFRQLTLYALPLFELLGLRRAKLAVIFPLIGQCHVREVDVQSALAAGSSAAGQAKDQSKADV